jgi:hypothetical protein
MNCVSQRKGLTLTVKQLVVPAILEPVHRLSNIDGGMNAESLPLAGTRTALADLSVG